MRAEAYLQQTLKRWVLRWVEKENGPQRPVFPHYLAEPESVAS